MENPKNTKTNQIEARITEEMDRELKRVAREQKRTESEIVRGAVEEYLRTYEKRKGER